jgi:hypothetical protein
MSEQFVETMSSLAAVVDGKYDPQFLVADLVGGAQTETKEKFRSKGKKRPDRVHTVPRFTVPRFINPQGNEELERLKQELKLQHHGQIEAAENRQIQRRDLTMADRITKHQRTNSQMPVMCQPRKFTNTQIHIKNVMKHAMG